MSLLISWKKKEKRLLLETMLCLLYTNITRSEFMKDHRTGQSLEKLLGAAKDELNQTDYDINLEQKNRKRDALAAETHYKNATPLEKANIDLDNAKKEVAAIEREKIGKNTDDKKYKNWQDRLKAAKMRQAEAQQRVNRFSPQTKVTAPKEQTKEQTEYERTLTAFKRTEKELPADRNDLHNIKAEHSYTIGDKTKLETQVTTLNTDITKTKSDLEKLKNPGLFTRLLNALSSSKQKEHKVKIENLDKKIEELGKNKNKLSSQIKNLSSKAASLDEQIKEKTKKLTQKENWIDDTRRELAAKQLPNQVIAKRKSSPER